MILLRSCLTWSLSLLLLIILNSEQLALFLCRWLGKVKGRQVRQLDQLLSWRLILLRHSLLFGDHLQLFLLLLIGQLGLRFDLRQVIEDVLGLLDGLTRVQERQKQEMRGILSLVGELVKIPPDLVQLLVHHRLL